MNKPKTSIIIVIEGGCIQHVFVDKSKADDFQLEVIDLDGLDDAKEHDELQNEVCLLTNDPLLRDLA